MHIVINIPLPEGVRPNSAEAALYFAEITAHAAAEARLIFARLDRGKGRIPCSVSKSGFTLTINESDE